jgi:pilus assembly protein TadC
MNQGWVLVSAAFAGLAVLAWSPAAAARLRTRDEPGPSQSASRARWRRIGSALATGAAVSFAAAGLGWVAILVGSGAAVASYFIWGHLLDAGEARRRASFTADLPQVCDLLVSCLQAGLPLSSGVAAVTGALSCPLADELDEALAKIALGVDEARVWGELAVHPPLATFGRELARGAATGVALTQRIAELGAEARREAAASVEVRVRRVGVHSVMPLMVCFLPAFVLLGLVPVIGGFIARFFG